MSYLKKIIKASLPLAAMLALAGAAGCNHERDRLAEMEAQGWVPGEEFRADDEVTPVDEIANAQIAAGARTDSTLRYHFNRGRLNSLGREKLDAMILCCDADGATGDEMVVYLDVPGGDKDGDKTLTDARKDAVANYLKENGVNADRIRLETGYNPDNTASALSALGSSATGGGTAGTGAPSASTGTSTPYGGKSGSTGSSAGVSAAK